MMPQKFNAPINIYWAPVYSGDSDWNMIYPDMDSLYDVLRINMNSDGPPNGNFFYCPAFSNLTKNTFIIKNPIKSHFIIENNKLVPQGSAHIQSDMFHAPSILEKKQIVYVLRYIFFTDIEENIDITLTSPYFNNSEHFKYGMLIPGRFSINNWFRSTILEFSLWNDVKEFIVEKDEHLAYINFSTNKPINLIRFEMNEKLHKYCSACNTSSKWEPWIPLYDRYKRFKSSRLKSMILKEIKQNIVS